MNIHNERAALSQIFAEIEDAQRNNTLDFMSFLVSEIKDLYESLKELNVDCFMSIKWEENKDDKFNLYIRFLCCWENDKTYVESIYIEQLSNNSLFLLQDNEVDILGRGASYDDIKDDAVQDNILRVVMRGIFENSVPWEVCGKFKHERDPIPKLPDYEVEYWSNVFSC